MRHTAKLFTNGRSQAVRLPAAYRFETQEVFIRKDPKTGDVILSRKPANWDDFFIALKAASVPKTFLGKKNAHREFTIEILLEMCLNDLLNASTLSFGIAASLRDSQ